MLYDTIGHARLLRRPQVMRGLRLRVTGRMKFR